VAGDRLNLTLNFASSDRPQVTYTKQGKAWVALLNGAQLQLGNGNASYAKANPAPGITAIEATQYAANKVQIRVTAVDPAMLKDLIKRQDTGDSLVFSLEMQPSATQANTLSAADAPEAGILNSQNSPNTDKVLIAQNTNADSVGKPLFEPKVTITDADGKTRVAQSNAPNSVPPPVANPVTPQLQGRVPGVVPPFRQIKTPPVGDIATTTSKLRPDIVELGTAERVPRITLRDAPAIEVLTLIGRVAGLSVVSAEAQSTTGAAAPTTTGARTGLKQPVSLDIENETAQDVFNNVLRITGLDANRVGQTIFVATKLPVTLKNLVAKSYRLNQITAGEASAYLIGLGATRVVNRQRAIPGVQTATIGSAAATVVNVTTESVPTLETVAITDASGITALLKGMQIIAEERSNSVTLVGSPKQVEYAEAQLARLDLRKRQVTVNVRVVEVSLNSDQTVNGFLSTEGGNPSINQVGNTLGINFASNQPITLPNSFAALLTANIQNGRAKVLTDPNLTVQEGESATVALTQEVPGGTERVDAITNAEGIVTTPASTRTITKKAGLTLIVQIDRIDDNGFVNLSISPTISAISGSTQNPDTSTTVFLAERTLNSGKIRLRDGQTFILSGVIQDTDRETTSKVPILGDLPIIGALFRSSITTNIRNEVVIIVTPRIIDDSQNANFGYTYQPGPETQKVLDSNQRKIQ
jgi:type IV pilus assembly protein PilQ